MSEKFDGGLERAKHAGQQAGEALRAILKDASQAQAKFDAIPAGAMRVAPGTDAVVWRICPDHSGEL